MLGDPRCPSGSELVAAARCGLQAADAMWSIWALRQRPPLASPSSDLGPRAD